MLSGIRTNYSRRGALGVVLRGDKLGKKDFWYVRKCVRHAQVQNDGVIPELKLVNGQRRMTCTVGACIAIIVILVLFKRGTRTLVRCGHFSLRSSVACRGQMTLHGVSVIMHTIDRDGQRHYQEKPRKEFQGDKSSHE